MPTALQNGWFCKDNCTFIANAVSFVALHCLFVFSKFEAYGTLKIYL